MTITTNDDRDEYTATSGQTVFNYTFRVYESTDLNVYQTPASQDFDDSADLITAYTVSGVGSSSGGTITLSSGAASGDRITIVSAIPSSRTTDYQVNGDFTPSVVNDDFDRSISLQKQAEGLARRSPKFSESRQGVSEFSLPKPIANTFWRVNSTATGMESFTANGAAVTAEIPAADYTALRALVSTSQALTDGQVITVTNDGIAGQFVVKTGTVTDNGGTLIVFNDDSNRYCERVFNGPVYARWFEADNTGVENVANIFNNINAYCVSTSNYKGVVVDEGRYLQTGRINWSPFVKITSAGYVVFDVNMTSGFSWNIDAQHGDITSISGSSTIRPWQQLFSGFFEFKNENLSNTCTWLLVGSEDTATSTLATSMISVKGVSTFQFSNAIEFGDHSYLIRFQECHFLGSYNATQRALCDGVGSRARNITDSGTNIVFDQCNFAHLGNVINTEYTNGRLYLYFINCELGANERLLKAPSSRSSGGDIITLTDTYFESTWDFGYSAFEIENGAEVHIKGGNMYGANSTYQSPIFANVKTSGKLTIDNLQIGLDNAVAIFAQGDATSDIQIGKLSFRVGTTVPTSILSTTGASGSKTYTDNISIGNVGIDKNPTVKWGIDFATSASSNNKLTLANAATLDLAEGSGIVVLHSDTDGDSAIFICYGGTTVKLGGSSNYVASSPSSGQVGLYYSGASALYRVENQKVATQDLYISTIRTRPSV